MRRDARRGGTTRAMTAAIMAPPRLPRWLVVAAIVVVAAALRLWDLELRPPHHDEGVNGWFVERMHGGNAYAYDPHNYHGPSYFYLLSASRELFGFGLWQLRLPGALLGVALCLVPLLARQRLGWGRAVAACVLLACSPTLVYYARYAIHETLLVGLELLVAACVLRWADSSRGAWLVGAAAALAAMIATKETTILFLGVSGLWLLGEIAVGSWRARRLVVLGRSWRWSAAIPLTAAAALAVMLTIHVVAFTGAFQARGAVGTQLGRSIEAYALWQRTGTDHGGHVKDVCYYLHLGARYELALLVLAAIGLATGWRERWIRGPGLVGVGLLGAYSAIAYKMPWLPMSWLALLALPASHGVIVVGRVLAREVAPRFGARSALALACAPALVIALRVSFVHPADAREQLAYVHTDADYNRWFPLIEAGARQVGAKQLTIAVEHDAQWPLAWSLGPYPRTRWSAGGDEDVLIVATDRVATVEPRLRTAYLRREFRVRDSAAPAVIYLRRSIYARVLRARGEQGFTLFTPAPRADATAESRTADAR